MAMVRSYDVDVALEYGVEVAILLNYLYTMTYYCPDARKEKSDNKLWLTINQDELVLVFLEIPPMDVLLALQALIECGLVESVRSERDGVERMRLALTESGKRLVEREVRKR